MYRVSDGLRVGYVLNTFPKLSETFVLNEILGLERAGAHVAIFSVWPAGDPRIHATVADLKADVYYLYSASDLIENLKDLRKLEGSYHAGLEDAIDAARQLFRDQAGPRLAEALRLASIAVEERLDHLHAHFMLTSAQATYLAHVITGIPFTVTAHAFDIYNKRANAEVFTTIAQASERVVTVCDANREFIADTFLEGDREHVVRIYNGLPLETLPRFERPMNRRLIFGAGRLVEKKGWNVLLEACRILKDRGCDFRCVIAGGGPDQDELLALQARLGLDDEVEFLGALRSSDVLEWMSSARVLASPCVKASTGDQDALPTVLLEALSLGLPVVTTPVGGIPEIVEHGIEGLIVTEGDPGELATSLELLLDDDDLWTSLSEAGPKKVASTFDLRDTLPQLIDVFSLEPSESSEKSVAT